MRGLETARSGAEREGRLHLSFYMHGRLGAQFCLEKVGLDRAYLFQIYIDV